MATWTCPDCDRTFGKAGQGHMCNPGLTVEEFLTASSEFVAPVFHRVHAHLVDVDEREGGDLIVDPLEKKVLFKHGPTFCILDVKTKWVALGFTLRHEIQSEKLSRKTVDYGGKFFHVVNVAEPDVIDADVEGWLTEAYHLDATPKPSAHDPMIPDDIDFELG